MKWTKAQEEKLRELCFEEKTNAELAKIFDCDLRDIHVARSRLGITIPKVKAAKEKTVLVDPWKPIEKAFDKLDTALLEAAVIDPVNSQNLRQVAAGVSVFKSLLLNAVE